MALDRTKYNDDETTHHALKSERRRREVEPAKMRLNLTSMIDVVFQLLIYFIITANFALDEGVIAARLPAGGPAQASVQPKEKAIKIRIESYGSTGYIIDVEGYARPANFMELGGFLREQRADGGGSGLFSTEDPVKIEPQGAVRWQHVVNAFNATKAAGYTDVRFVPPSS